MAISHAQHLLWVLVSLFVLPALGLNYEICKPIGGYFITVNDANITPDPVKANGNANLTITGFANKEIPDRATIGVRLLGRGEGGVFSDKKYSLCDVTACPVSSGPVVLTLSNIFDASILKFEEYVGMLYTPTGGKIMCVRFWGGILSSSLSSY